MNWQIETPLVQSRNLSRTEVWLTTPEGVQLVFPSHTLPNLVGKMKEGCNQGKQTHVQLKGIRLHMPASTCLQVFESAQEALIDNAVYQQQKENALLLYELRQIGLNGDAAQKALRHLIAALIVPPAQLEISRQAVIDLHSSEGDLRPLRDIVLDLVSLIGSTVSPIEFLRALRIRFGEGEPVRLLLSLVEAGKQGKLA